MGRDESLPLLVILHGCGQDAEALAASSRMNTTAARERFFVLYPERFRAIAMHSGIAPGVAHSSAGAIKAMFGKSVTASPLPAIAPDARLPALLVIHGAADHVVAPGNGAEAAMRWGARVGARASKPRGILTAIPKAPMRHG